MEKWKIRDTSYRQSIIQQDPTDLSRARPLWRYEQVGQDIKAIDKASAISNNIQLIWGWYKVLCFDLCRDLWRSGRRFADHSHNRTRTSQLKNINLQNQRRQTNLSPPPSGFSPPVNVRDPPVNRWWWLGLREIRWGICQSGQKGKKYPQKVQQLWGSLVGTTWPDTTHVQPFWPPWPIPDFMSRSWKTSEAIIIYFSEDPMKQN